ncbi:hypothetical protein C7N43_22865 [Sphingobacteriales bacterium UPWRP_1]|nr:hypothetical protein B6N25_14920 [Sphingobacteriales bacterium TSM_CSS]PSJ74682.1 hypothetical protein C7N43_22865 [Sphingobacteriales bacterium UPWRP_1]
MKLTKWYLAAFLLAAVWTFSLSSCDDDDNTPDYNLTFKVKPLVNGQPFQLGVDYTSPESQRFMYEKFLFYLSKVKLIADDGAEQPVADVMWYNLGNPETVKLKVPEGQYNNLQFSLGLDSLMNSSDPTDYEEGHPLSYSQNNYWTWASKYIFAKLEGRCDNNLSGTGYTGAFSYHLGLDTLYREKSVPRNVTITNNTVTNVELVVNVDLIFDGIDIVEDNFTHSTSDFALAEQIMNNFVAATQ